MASVSVLLWHSMLGFFPGLSGAYPATLGDGLTGHPWYGLLFGTAAVNLFFVLSGYVLTRTYLRTGDRSLIDRGALKRWPRLAGPVLISVLFSFALFSLGLYHYNEAGALTHSPWLVGHLFQGQPVLPWKFLDALAQGVFFTFFRENAAYWNTVLWTMRWEFVGSFLAFGLALLIQPLRPPQRALFLAIAVLLTQSLAPQLIPFPVGAALAAFLPQAKISKAAPSTIVLLTGIYRMGFTGRPVGAYTSLYETLGPNVSLLHVQTVAAVLIIVGVETSTVMHRLLSHRWAAWLGAMSFPLYLVHIPILCSFGSLAALATGRGVVGAAVTIVLAFVAAVPLKAFNEWWVAWLNRRFTPARPIYAAAAA